MKKFILGFLSMILFFTYMAFVEAECSNDTFMLCLAIAWAAGVISGGFGTDEK